MVEHHLVSIPFSHYNEKARWGLSFYRVPYEHSLFMPILHRAAVKAIPDRPDPDRPWSHKAAGSALSTPYLITPSATYHDSQDILLYLSSRFSPSLYPTPDVAALEARYDENLGPATRRLAYHELLVRNRWSSMYDFAVLGFRNGVGILQGTVWFLTSPLIGQLLCKYMRLHNMDYMEESTQMVRAEFEAASARLATSTYLAGDTLSAADIAFASLAAPVLCIENVDGFQMYPPLKPTSTHVLRDELRATKAGKHALRLFREERYYGGPLPTQQRSWWGLW